MATEEDVRRIALALPEVIEKSWYGTPGYRVKDKGFLRLRTEAEGGLVVSRIGHRQPARHRRRRTRRADRRLVAGRPHPRFSLPTSTSSRL
jgi:hypothetical protein